MKPKLKNKFKLTPDIHKEILVAAQTLPQFQRVDAKGKPMTRIITKFVRTEKISESQMRNHFQKIEEPIMVNHEVNMIECFKKDGPAGIKGYVDTFLDIAKEHQQKPEDGIQQPNNEVQTEEIPQS